MLKNLYFSTPINFTRGLTSPLKKHKAIKLMLWEVFCRIFCVFPSANGLNIKKNDYFFVDVKFIKKVAEVYQKR